MIKKLILLVPLLLGTALLFAEGEQETGKIDYLTLTWDELIEEAKKESALTLSTSQADQFWKDAAQDFKTAYEIDITVAVEDADTVVQKIIADKDTEIGTIDAVLISNGMVEQTIAANVFYGPLLDSVPNSASLDSKLSQRQQGVFTKGYLVPIYRSQVGFLYDSQKLSEPPQTWLELSEWISANPGQFAFCEPGNGDSGLAFVQMVVAYLGGGLEQYKDDDSLNQEKLENWDAAWEWLRDTKSSVTMTATDTDAIQRLNQGTITLAVAWEKDVRSSLQQNTLSSAAKFYVPKMGLPGGGDSIGVPGNAPNKAAALLFCAYLVDQEAQLKMNESLGHYLARTDIQPTVPFISEEVRQKFGIDWMAAPYLDYIKQEFGSRVATD